MTPFEAALARALHESRVGTTGCWGRPDGIHCAIHDRDAAAIVRSLAADPAWTPLDGLNVERLARALVASDLIRRYDEYARAAYPATMTRDHIDTLAREWAAHVRAALRDGGETT